MIISTIENHMKKMKKISVKRNKGRVTITLNPELLDLLDRFCKKWNHASRSFLVEQFIEQALKKGQQRELEEATEAYYRSLTSEEREEDRSWTALSSRQAIGRFN